jgi:hypothetical protein
MTKKSKGLGKKKTNSSEGLILSNTMKTKLLGTLELQLIIKVQKEQ